MEDMIAVRYRNSNIIKCRSTLEQYEYVVLFGDFFNQAWSLIENLDINTKPCYAIIINKGQYYWAMDVRFDRLEGLRFEWDSLIQPGELSLDIFRNLPKHVFNILKDIKENGNKI